MRTTLSLSVFFFLSANVLALPITHDGHSAGATSLQNDQEGWSKSPPAPTMSVGAQPRFSSAEPLHSAASDDKMDEFVRRAGNEDDEAIKKYHDLAQSTKDVYRHQGMQAMKSRNQEEAAKRQFLYAQGYNHEADALKWEAARDNSREYRQACLDAAKEHRKAKEHQRNADQLNKKASSYHPDHKDLPAIRNEQAVQEQKVVEHRTRADTHIQDALRSSEIRNAGIQPQVDALRAQAATSQLLDRQQQRRFPPGYHPGVPPSYPGPSNLDPPPPFPES